jgi:bacterioferritin-associated ferredoxin
LESLQKAIFPFASRGAVQYRSLVSSSLSSMIVCSCNVISDQDIRHAVSTADELPRNAKDVYGCLGCSAACGRCARTIKTIVDEALGPCARQCQDGCAHDRTSIAPDQLTPDRFALAAA